MTLRECLGKHKKYCNLRNIPSFLIVFITFSLVISFAASLAAIPFSLALQNHSCAFFDFFLNELRHFLCFVSFVFGIGRNNSASVCKLFVGPQHKSFEYSYQLQIGTHMQEFPEFIEEEEEEESWPTTIRLEIIEYILRRHGALRAPDLAHILDWKVREINRVLRQLESSGRAKRMKLGKNYVWSSVEEPHLTPMHY